MSNLFPAAANTGSSLQNSRATNDTIPAADHNDLANAIIAHEAKYGTGASTPTTLGQVLTVTGSGVTAWQTPSGGGGGSSNRPYFNVKDYGALGNGAQDDTSFIQSAINAALATQRGTAAVYFPAGIYKITSTLNCSSSTSGAGGKGVFLVGDGRESSQIFKNGNQVGVEWLGHQGPTYPNQFGGIRDITINGNAKTGAAVHVVGGQQMEFSTSSIIGNNDVALDLDTCQDSYFFDITFNNCGSTTHRVIEMYGGAYGTTNMMWFEQIRVETFYLGAVSVIAPAGQRGVNGGNNGFFFSQCKFENYPTVHGDICVFDSYSQQVDMSDIFISAGTFDSGFSTAVNGVVFGDGTASVGHNQASFRNFFMNAGTSIGAAIVKIDGTNMSGPVTLDNLYADTTFTQGVTNVTNAGNLDVRQTQIYAPSGPLKAGDGSAHDKRTGSGTLNGSGTVTISTTRVFTNARIQLTRTSSGTGVLYRGTITSGTSFVVNSSNGSDAGTFDWAILD